MADDVASQHTVLSHRLGSKVAGCAMKPHTKKHSLSGRISLCQKSCDNACQHIAAARSGHTRIAHIKNKHIAFRCADMSGMAFKGNIDSVGLCVFRHHFYSIATYQPSGFSEMWRENAARRKQSQQGFVASQQVQCIGIVDGWHFYALHKIVHQSFIVQPQP